MADYSIDPDTMRAAAGDLRRASRLLLSGAGQVKSSSHFQSKAPFLARLAGDLKPVAARARMTGNGLLELAARLEKHADEEELTRRAEQWRRDNEPQEFTPPWLR